MQFKYHYLANKLAHLDPNNPEYSYIVPEERTFTTQYGGQGFILEPCQHWITFTILAKSIQVFYKRLLSDGEIIYYKRESAKTEMISFAFTEEDRVIKSEKGCWVSKNGS